MAKKIRANILFPAVFCLFFLTACAPVVVGQASGEQIDEGNATIDPPRAQPTATHTTEPTAAPTETDLPMPTEEIQPSHADNFLSCEDPFGDARIRFNPSFWPNTDFCQHSVDFEDFLSGGPPPDGIPAIDSPVFETVTEADAWLGDGWPVMFFEWDGVARAYPLAILMWHEIVNDVVNGQPVTLTFCPLCNATIAFNRVLPDGTVLDFGTSGNLRNSDLVMYDRQTRSWWQQFTGEALVGVMTGTTLEFLPSQIIAWEDFKSNFPDSEVLSRNTGHVRSYGANPYAGYDNINNNPFLFDGVVDGRLPAMERVVAIEVAGIDIAYPFSILDDAIVVNDDVEGVPLVVLWTGNTVSALDRSSFDSSRVIGSTAVYKRDLDGQVLTFEAVEGGFRDIETGSIWDIFGHALEGPLAGSKLEQIVSAEHFWFSWAVFKPDTVIWEGQGGGG